MDKSKKTAEWLRLKDNHPTMIKLMKLYQLSEELGLHLSFSNHRCIVEDDERDASLPTMLIEDCDSSDYPIMEWPPATEFKVIYQNPVYLLEQEEERQRRCQKDAEEAKARSERDALAAKERKLQQDKEKEVRERAQLAELKAKYPD